MTLHHYESNSGKDLIMEYINSLTEDERVDALSVLKCMENGEFDKITTKRWEKKIWKYISISITEYFILQMMVKISICYMLVESRKIKRKNKIRKSSHNEQKSLVNY